MQHRPRSDPALEVKCDNHPPPLELAIQLAKLKDEPPDTKSRLRSQRGGNSAANFEESVVMARW
jgi:hypothetical protein